MYFTFARLNVKLFLLGSIQRVIGKFKIRIRTSFIKFEIFFKYYFNNNGPFKKHFKVLFCKKYNIIYSSRVAITLDNSIFFFFFANRHRKIIPESKDYLNYSKSEL